MPGITVVYVMPLACAAGGLTLFVCLVVDYFRGVEEDD